MSSYYFSAKAFPFHALLLATALLVFATNQVAQATPEESFGMSCVSCHDAPRDTLRVNGDPDVLPTFTVEAGGTVQLSFDISGEDGDLEESEYILGIRGLDAPGFDPRLGSNWEYRSGEAYPYVLNDEYKNPRSFTLEVAIDPSTPADLYSMDAIVAGEGKDEDEDEANWYDIEPFYLRVTSNTTVPEPSTFALVLTTLAASLPLMRKRKRINGYRLEADRR